MWRRISGWKLPTLLGLCLWPGPVGALEISHANCEGRAQFVVKTAAAEYWLDANAGGLSRLIDRDGRDWISFRREPLCRFPDSAAAGYRCIPNAIFGVGNPDAGTGHPGFDRCESSLTASNLIRVVNNSSRWAWTWTLTDESARLKFEKVDGERAYWCLYEGTPAWPLSSSLACRPSEL